MPTRIIKNVETGELIVEEISETERRREVLGLPLNATDLEINDAWQIFTTEQLAAQNTEDVLAQLQRAADVAFRLIDWAQKISAAQAGQTLIDQMAQQITDIDNATSLAAVKTPLVAFLTKQRTLDQGFLNEAVENLTRWRRLLQYFRLTGDTTP